jgi:hypothetical protein
VYMIHIKWMRITVNTLIIIQREVSSLFRPSVCSSLSPYRSRPQSQSLGEFDETCFAHCGRLGAVAKAAGVDAVTSS